MNAFCHPAELRAPSRFRCLGLRGDPHHDIQLAGRFELQRWHDVGVDVERDPDLRMAEAFLDYFGMNAGGEQKCGGRARAG